MSVSDVVVGINLQGLPDNDKGMNIYQVWQQGITGKGVVVAVVDEGLQQSHPELADNYVGIVNRSRNDVVCVKLKGTIETVKNSRIGINYTWSSNIAVSLGYVHTIPNRSCAGTKTILDQASVHT